MTISPNDLGEIGSLATAIGLINASGEFQKDWLTRPGDYLSEVLANETQREALIAFLDAALGGSERRTDSAERIWLPIIEENTPNITIYVVLDESQAGHVRLGLGVGIRTTSPDSETTLHLPLFKAAKDGHSVDNIVLLGSAGSAIGFATEITIDAGAPTPGAAHLGRIGIGFDVPTFPGEQPVISLTLGALQLPGAAAPRDLTISLDSLDELDDAALELVLGLIQAQAEGLPPGPLTAVAGMLGLRGGIAVPPLPIADFATLGPRALAIWFNQVTEQASVRTAWFNELATLLGGGAAASADGVSFTLGAARVTIGVRRTTGTGGAGVITPTLSATIASGSIRAEGAVELARIDLGTGAAVALPQLSVLAHLGHTTSGGTAILTGDPSVQAVRLGIALNADRKPIPILAADGVVINGHIYDMLDLSTPDAAVESLGTALTDIVDDVLDQLGPVGTVVRVLLGLAPPAGAPGVPTIDLGAFLSNPLAAVGDHWRTLLRDHASAIPEMLDQLRSLIADAGAAAPPIAGTGTADDPWRLPLIGPVALQFRAEAGGDRLNVALACAYAVDTLGQRCTRIDTRLIVGLANIDFVTGTLVVAGSVEARLTARARGDTRARFAAGPIALSADHIGLSARWTAESGLAIEALAPHPAAEFKGEPIPIALPTFDAGGAPSLDDAGWDAVERLLGLLGSQSPLPAFRDLVSMLGWIPDGPNLADDPTLSGRPRLRLAAFAADPATALKTWALALLLEQSPRIESAITVLARQLTGSADDLGRLAGAGRPEAPYRLPLFDDGFSPQLAFWLEPHGPARPTLTNVPDEIRDWRPGKAGFDGALLANALMREGELAESIATLVASRDDLAAGLDALIARWIGTDGRIVPPATDPVGISVHRMTDVTIDRLGAAINADQILGGAPAVRIHVAVVASGASIPWPAAPPERVIDLRAPGLAPESFAEPAVSAGEWYIALGGRAAARLATGDADGIAGQAARLQRVLPAFTGLGSVALIASAEAGHAARRAAEAVPTVTSLVTIGTPAGPVSFSVLDTTPAAEALRVLLALLPAFDPAEPDDFDLARGRALISALTDLLPLGDPGVDLRPPAVLPGAPRAGLAVHAVYGSVRAEAVLAALTAVVAAGLSLRAGVRAPQLATPPTGAAIGIYFPVAVRGDGLVMRAEATIDALGFDFTTPGGPSIRTASSLRLMVSFARESGWLVGGPDPARGPGPRPEHELRRIEATVTLPLYGSGTASAEIVLIEPKVFGIGRERWVVRAGGAASTFEEVVTPALPEVRVLLAQFAAQLSTASDPTIAAVRQILDGLGLFDASGGLVADGIDHLLNEPATRVAESLTSVARRTNLQTGIAALTGALSGVTIDLAARRLSLSLSGVPGTIGMMPWSLDVEIEPASAPRFHFALEPPSAGPEGALSVHLRTRPFALTLQRHRPGAVTPQIIPLWPNPDGDALLAAITRLAPAELARLGLEYLRQLDETARPIVDAAYDAVGLLGPATMEGVRGVRLPLELIENPFGWLAHAGALGGASGFDPAKLIALFDAFKPILGVAGAPGEWNLASGVTLRTDSSAGAARLGLQINSSSFAPIPTAAGRLNIAGTFALALPPGLPPRPAVDVSLGLSGAAPGRRAIHVASEGGLQVFLRPDSGPDLPLYPNPPGLARLAEVAVTQALPLILDALADQTGAGLAGDVGSAVRAVGDALALRTGTPAHFDGAALQAWAANPASAFAARLPALSATALGALATALDPLLPAPATVSSTGGQLTVSIGGVGIRLQPTPFAVTLTANLTGIPAFASVEASVTLDATGLAALDLELGPADIDAGGFSLHPYLAAAVGNAPDGGRRIQLGLALDAAGTRTVGARWLLDGPTFALTAAIGASETTDPESVALALVDAVVQLVASFALTTQAVDDLLDTTVAGSAGTQLREVLRGVFLRDVPSPDALDSNLFDRDLLLGRLQRLLVNVASAGPSIDVGGGLTIGMQTTGTVAELTLGIAGRIDLTPGPFVIAIEADSRWIQGTPAAGLALGIVDTAGGGLTFAPSLVVNGIGIRVSRQGAPLLDAGVTLGSAAMHLFGRVSAAELAGGVQIQLSELAAGVAGASGGNPIAQGMVADAGSGPERLAPSFSPALAIQKHGAGPILVSLRAGDGDGPWWLAIQKGFGPIYIEQVGFDTTVTQDQLVDISLLLDGRVSIAGLTAAVDDLKLTFLVTSEASIFEPSHWDVDLAGLAVEADLGGVMLAGGLRKFGAGENAEYVGMLLARLAVYGVSIYGGYGSKEENGERFTSFFAFGAINGPIGGPPAFFLTGIGGGVGINRDLIFPTELNRFGEFPFIKALDPAATPSADPMAELALLREIFPMKRGDFWFAAGLSFTSFALVDGVAVISVKIGDGLELALLGLARVALPRPQVALVSIELGLIARFSTKEGVLWVQAQLTDNSWLLHESARLTGGFAYVSWFDGPRQGEFVLTIGGFHPSFQRAGYPVVPRLGFCWQVGSAIVAKGESYFALTSEALMAGGKIEVSARFGPAWAEVKFGADGIVYFDPFSFQVEAYARIAAGVTIDVWIGEITISISLGARLMVEGPKFHGTATFEVGPIELTVPFGDRQNGATLRLPWSDFVPKYLEEASPSTARCLSALPGKGSLPPGTGAGGTSEKGTADGSAAKPFEVFSEFEITITTTIPTRTLSVAGASEVHLPSRNIGLAPVGADNVDTILELHLRDTGSADHLHKLIKEVQRTNGFPVGVWGDPHADDDRKVPKGEVIEAVGGVRFEAIATIEGSLPHEMAYHQVESGPRRPLPFLHARRARSRLILAANATAAVLPAAAQIEAMYAAAMPWLALGGNGRTALAALARERVAPPRLGSLTEGLAAGEAPRPHITLPPHFVRPPVDMMVRPAEAIAILSGELTPELHAPRTTVSDPGGAARMPAPRLADIEAATDWAIPAKLVRMAAPAAVSGRTLIAQGNVPLTRSGQAGVAAVSGRGAASAGRHRLTEMSRALVGGRSRASSAAAISPGEIVVLRLPNATRDVDRKAVRPRLLAAGGPVRLVAMSAGGRIVHDGPIVRGGASVPPGTERLAVLAIGERSDKQGVSGLLGWHDSQNLPYLGWTTAMIAGGTLRAEGAPVRRNRQRFRAGWVPASALIADAPLIITRFATRITSVAVIIEDPTGAASAQNLSLGLVGADRATDRAGKPLPPTLIAMGHRSILVYAIRMRAGEKTDAVQVTVAREEAWRLAGVLASELSAVALADRLTEHGIERAQQPLAAAREGAVRLSWSTPPGARAAAKSRGKTKARATKPKRRSKTKRTDK